MARNPKIRITKNDRKEYERLVRNTKDKIRRTAEKYGVNLRNEVSIPKLEDIKTREQLNEVEAQLRSFTNRYNTKYQFVKNEEGVAISKRKKQELEEKTKRVQRIEKKLKEEAEKRPRIVRGKKEGTVGQQMKQMAQPENLTGISTTPDFDFSKIKDKARLEQIEKRLNERLRPEHFNEKQELLKSNYILMLERSFNSDSNALAERIKNISASDFYEMYLTYQEFDFPEYYTKEHMGESHNELIELLNSYIDRYEDGEMDMDFKPFQ